MSSSYLSSVLRQFQYYKLLGDKTIAQLEDEEIFWQYNASSNSVAIIVKHMWGNMMSRWKDFLISDGEKTWRDRDAEFQNDISSREELNQKWEEGWSCLFSALDELKEDDLERIIFIRNQGHTVLEAINRQLSHYSYHVGQLIFIGKMLRGEKWVSLSIAQGQSQNYNEAKFSAGKSKSHFTDEYFNKKDNRQ